MAVRITSNIAPTHPLDTFGTHDSIYGIGGHREVRDIETRNSIFNERRKEGMTVYVKEDRITYQLIGGIDNENWVVFKGATGETKLSYIEADTANIGNLLYFDGTKIVGVSEIDCGPLVDDSEDDSEDNLVDDSEDNLVDDSEDDSEDDLEIDKP